jgi:hypothetical protein
MHGTEQVVVVFQCKQFRPVGNVLCIDDLIAGLEGSNDHPVDRQRNKKEVKQQDYKPEDPGYDFSASSAHQKSPALS